ncbi:glycosyltransferase [Macrococcus hajekii]|uniref:Glycosyltransferase n=1 Tax=Macrococcus hajekii TaxID=198482 RepID=A0A4R6BI40_9STAP|nr:glycosyltransferase [Macrococcus hajekii]TDM01279.1 glycosyltransferase [Macrococcus hajekii]GGB10289.1 monofunctional glycosyltransferase [Macrococcus hajekii]
MKKMGCGLLTLLLVVVLIVSSFFYFISGRVDLDEIKKLQSNQYFVSADHMPKYVPDAFIAVEDKRFYQHDGIDWKGTGRSAGVALKNRTASQGGSTITQQLAKNLYLSSDKKLSRKLNEMMIAKRIENNFSKNDIISAYLTTIYFGDGIYNIEKAANTYFGTTTDVTYQGLPQITVLQSAILASTINAPSEYHPDDFESDTALQARTRSTLDKMHDQSLITDEQYNEAITGIPNSN